METVLEKVLMNSHKSGMILYMHDHPESFEEAVNLAVSEKQPYSWRAAWLLWSCIEDNDARVNKYIKKIVKSLKDKNDDHQRELIKILFKMELDEKDEGFLFNFCLNIWEKTAKKPSVRYTALKMIIKIAKKHPDLINEVNCLFQNNYTDSLSQGVKKSLSTMIKELNQIRRK